jgi:hypothetical protein
VFENRVLRKIFGPKRDEVTGEWRKLHNEELHNLYSFPDIIRQVKSRRVRWAGHEVQGFFGKARRKETPRKTKRRWEEMIRMDLREIGLGGVDWVRLAQNRDRWRAVVSVVMNLLVLAPRAYLDHPV